VSQISSLFVRAIAQTISHRPLTTTARIRDRFNTCGICHRQNGTGTVSPSSSDFPVNVIPPFISILTYNLGDEQQAHWWPQFRDVVSPNRHEQEQHALSFTFWCLIAACSKNEASERVYVLSFFFVTFLLPHYTKTGWKSYTFYVYFS
jgi:hypothetical protein